MKNEIYNPYPLLEEQFVNGMNFIIEELTSNTAETNNEEKVRKNDFDNLNRLLILY